MALQSYDWVVSRNVEQFAPRDNAVLELGICIGALRLAGVEQCWQE